MAKPLNINLGSQTNIVQEGEPIPVPKANTRAPIPVPSISAQRKTDFFVPEYELQSVDEIRKTNSANVQYIVDRVNQYIDNIADDYFLLGLHLIALHKLLRQSKMSIEQIKNWYAENVNMPYSSAMQCRKVAEVYQEQPDLINRYTASGAYLLSSFKTHEEREAIWEKARGKKASPSIQDLRTTLKQHREHLMLSETPSSTELKPFLMSSQQIHDSFKELAKWSKQLLDASDEDKEIELRQMLAKSCKQLIEQMQKREPSS